jgi:hypothetical protein
MQNTQQIQTKSSDAFKFSKARYELSLSEFPVTLLSKSASNRDAIEYRDAITGKDGELVERVWKVYPDAKHGFGTSSTLSTLYELFQVWNELGFADKMITFGTLYSFAKRKRIKPTNTAYSTLRRDLRCLAGLVVEAKNAFWDNQKRAYVDAYFHLFDRVRFYKETPSGQTTLPLSYIEASDELFGSVVMNNLLVCEFDGEFFHSLKPTEQRLALYLSKMLRNQDVHKRDIMKLAEQLPLTAILRKKIKQQLKLATQGLVEKSFQLLDGYAFEKNCDGDGENIVFFRKRKTRRGRRARQGKPGSRTAIPQKTKPPAAAPVNPDYVQDCLIQDVMAACGDENSLNFYRKVARRIPKELVYQALAEMKEVRDLGTIKKSRGALFTKLIKDKARNFGINL